MSRLGHGDLARVVSIVAVVLIHASGGKVVSHGSVPQAVWWQANLVDSACRWAVPVFVMLAGTLAVGSAARRGLAGYAAQRLHRLGLPLAVWAAFSFGWKAWFQGQPVDAAFVSGEVWAGFTSNHLYFLPLLLGASLLVAPFAGPISRAPAPVIAGLAGLLWVAAATGWLWRLVPANLLTLGVPYLSWFLLGHLLRRGVPLGAPGAGLAFLGATAWIALETGSRHASLPAGDPALLACYGHFHPLVLVQSLGALGLLQHAGRAASLAGARDVLGAWAPYVFGVYLVHHALLDLVRSWTWGIQVAAPLWLGLLALEVGAVLGLSLLACLLLARVPWLRATIGLGDQPQPLEPRAELLRDLARLPVGADHRMA